MARIGLFGGSFDPPHLGHKALAQFVCDALQLDRVEFVPCRKSPHKQNQVLSHNEDRLAMLERLLADDTRLHINTVEWTLPEPSYTVDTLRHVKPACADDTLFLILGEDQWRAFPTWKECDTIKGLAQLVVVRRKGAAEALFSDAGVCVLENPYYDYASNEIREKVRRGQGVVSDVGADVAGYIAEQKLYKV